MNKTLKRVALFTGAAHVAALFIFYVYIHSSAAERSQAALYWIIWFFVDFPVSMLATSPAIIQACKNLLMTDSLNNVLLLLHGTLGTLWWMALAIVVGALWQRFRPSRQ